MKTANRLCICTLLLAGLCITTTHADEPPKKKDNAKKKVDNPRYKHWAQFRPGDFCLVKTTAKRKDMHYETTMKYTLKSISPDVIILDTEFNNADLLKGMKFQPLVDTTEIPAKIPEDHAKGWTEPEGKIGEGEETLTVLGKKIKTTWIKQKITRKGETTITKTWYSEDVPGREVKSHSRSDGPKAMTVTSELVDYAAAGKSIGDKKAPAKKTKKSNKTKKKASKPTKKDGASPKETGKDAKKKKS